MATPTKHTQDAFWRSVCKSPDDDTVRLVFADWLKENGYTPRARARAPRSDPLALGRDRGELIRVQCALARTPDGDPARTDLEVREHDLLGRHRETWLWELPRWLAHTFHGDETAFRRGFPSTLAHSAYQYASNARGLVTSSVIDEVELSDLTAAEVPKVAASPHLPRLRVLELAVTSAALQLPILSAPGLSGLRSLKLTDPTANDAGPVRELKSLLAAPAVRGLSSLELSLPRTYPKTTLGGLMKALGGAGLDRLTALDLVCKPTAGRHWETILRGSFAPNLTELRLNVNPEPAALEAVAGTDRLKGLRRLDLSLPSVSLGPTATEDGAKLLAAARQRPNLTCLRLQHCNDAAIAHVAASPLLDHLTELHVSFTTYSNGGVSTAGWRALLASGGLRNVRRLALWSNDLTDASLRAFAASKNLPSLECLDLRSNDGVTDDGLAALADSKHLGALRVVRVGSGKNNALAEARQEIEERFAGRFRVVADRR
jgi:uncharacterized protein (TIGR02996 family)